MTQGMIEQLDTPRNIVKNPANQYIRDFVINNLKLKINSLAQYMGAGD
jgi:ABC-type proline/glycine betaine transport system ATPase subunit